jgi:hypothetical protein
MAQPDVKSEIIAGPLAGVSVAYRNLEYIGDRIFPILDGSDPKVKITKYQKGAWFRDEAGIRAPGTKASRGGYPLTTVSVSTHEYAFAKEVTNEDKRFSKSQGAPVLDPEQDAIEFASDKIDMNKERRIASLITTGTWLDGASGGEDAAGLWAASSGNTFLADITKGKRALRGVGLKATGLLIDADTYESLKELDGILDKIKYTQRGVFGVDLLASLLELEEVLVGGGVYSDAEEAAAGDDFNAVDIWAVNDGKGMGFLYHKPKKVGLKIVTPGLQIRIAQDNGLPRRTERWYENAEHQDVFEVAEETDIVQVCADAAYLWNDTYAT